MKQKKKYIAPSAEIVKFTAEDIIVTSGMGENELDIDVYIENP